MTARVRLLLALGDYRSAAVFDHYDEGGHAMFDVAEAEIVEGERTGASLRVLVPAGSPEAAVWNRPGSTLRVSIGRASLESGATLFAGAFAIEDEA